MSKKHLLKIIELILAKHAKSQINLASGAARKEIASEILAEISSKYYLTSFSNLE